MLIFGAIFLFIRFGAVITRGIINTYRRDQFSDLESIGYQSMDLYAHQEKIRIKNPADIARMFKIIHESQKVGAHHSHPTDTILISFPHGT